MLRRFVRPPSSLNTQHHPRPPALNFGPVADDTFLRSGVDASELLAILQARVHCDTVEAFTYHIGLTIGWSTRDAAMLWTILEMPEVY